MTVAPGAPADPGVLLAAGPQGPVEYVVTGSGAPVTLFLHGLTGSIAQTRPFGSGVPGSRVFAHLRGHGGTPVPASGPGGWADLAAEADAVRTATGATRALGVSLGAGALLRLLADRPDAFDRVVLVVPPAPLAPAAPDAAGPRLLRDLADAVEARDPARAAVLLRDQQPAAVRRLPAVGLWARRRAGELAGTALPAVLRAFAGGAPLAPAAADPAPPAAGALAAVRAAVLVVAQEGDDVHPVAAARATADALPRAELVVLPAGGVLWSGRERLRGLLTDFLHDSE